ncbi:MAG: NAD(P)H-dependent oxidoreductase [Anaerolineae bacterium]|nr:NAD(P)H-dependent oxidoreductase [Anaerolineae bacterium]
MKALLLVGSPRLGRSASETLGGYLLEQLAVRGAETEKQYIYPALKSGEKLDALISAVARANLVILAAPLYVDSLPAAVIKFLETLAQRLGAYERPDGQQFLAISNCGFPEAHHNNLALEIYRRFAYEVGFAWAGGMAMGAGEAIKGRPLAESGGMARNVIAAFDLAAAALIEGKPVPQEAQDLIARPLMPAWLYRFMGNLGWYLQARQYGTLWKLRTRAL